MGAILTFLGSSIFRLIYGDIAAYFNKKQDQSLEMDRLRLQAELADKDHQRQLESIKLQQDLGIQTIRVQSSADLEKIDAAAFGAAAASVLDKTGNVYIDAWNGAIRPFLATLAILVVVGEVCAAGFILDDWDRELIGAILGLYVADRALAKRGK